MSLTFHLHRLKPVASSTELAVEPDLEDRRVLLERLLDEGRPRQVEFELGAIDQTAVSSHSLQGAPYPVLEAVLVGSDGLQDEGTVRTTQGEITHEVEQLEPVDRVATLAVEVCEQT